MLAENQTEIPIRTVTDHIAKLAFHGHVYTSHDKQYVVCQCTRRGSSPQFQGKRLHRIQIPLHRRTKTMEWSSKSHSEREISVFLQKKLKSYLLDSKFQ